MEDALAGLLGIDPEQLKGLLASLGPTPEMQAQADKQKWLTAGLGILAARPGNTLSALGQGGLLGVQAGQQSLQQQLAQRGTDLNQAMQLRQAQMQADAMKRMNAALSGGDQQQMQPGPPSSFQALGGADALMQAAASGGAPQARQLPTQQPMSPTAPSDLYDRLSKANLIGVAGGMKDMSPAITAAFPAPIVGRPNANIFDRAGRMIGHSPVAPPGYTFEPDGRGGSRLVPIPGGQEAIAAAEATPKAVSAAFKQQLGVLPGGGQGVVGTELGSTFGGGPLPYGAPQPFPGGQPAAPQAAPAGPVQTELSPEQKANSMSLGEEMSASRAAAKQSSKAQAELSQLAQTLNYFKPGPSLPARAAVAGYAQEVPGVGRPLADMLVPNSKTALPAIQAMEKISVGLTAEQSKVFGSREGQQVIGMIKSAMPNAAQVPGAPETIIQSQIGIHQWFIDHDQALQQWLSNPAHHGSSAGFEQAFDKERPVSSYIPDLPALKNLSEGKAPGAPRGTGSSAPPAAVEYLKAHPTMRGQFDAKYGAGAAEQALGR